MMNKQMMKRSLHTHVQLRPPVYRLDQDGFELQARTYVGANDTWFIEDVGDAGVKISRASGHFKTLSYDHIYKFTSDAPKNGQKRGFLTLLVQLYVQGNEICIEPSARPGEPVPPKAPRVVEKVVEISYPDRSGMQARLEAQGYGLGWARPERVSTLIDLKGHEEAIEADGTGGFTRFRTRDGMVLLRRRLSDIADR
jgi:hypothetical protein